MPVIKVKLPEGLLPDSQQQNGAQFLDSRFSDRFEIREGEMTHWQSHQNPADVTNARPRER